MGWAPTNVRGPTHFHCCGSINGNLIHYRQARGVTVRERPAVRRKQRNTEGNERLTAWVGATLFVLLAIEGLTIVSVQQLLVPHVVVGMLITAVAGLKIMSTGYRFFRYYSGDAAYRRKGPPAPLLRILGPIVILTTVAVLATGIALLYVPSSQMGSVLQLHKASFLLWFVAMAVHVLAYIWRVPGLILADLGKRVPVGRPGRILALALALVVGVATSLLVLDPARSWLSLFLSGAIGH
jgi:hypothetical protein